MKRRLARWNARWWLGDLLATDERVRLVAVESGGGGDVWVITNAATYINSKPSRGGRVQPHERNLRIPHDFVTALAQSGVGEESTLTVVALGDGTSREYLGRFASSDASRLACAITDESGVQVIH